MSSPLITPYSTLEYFWPTSMPTWIPDMLDQERITSYNIYEQIYWNVPTTFKLVYRGQEDKPIYVPSARTIIEATNRYIAPDFGFVVVPRMDAAVPDEAIAQATQVLNDLFTRERFFSKFLGNKRYGLIRGDWAWHIVADPAKLEGTRISIYPLDPGSYFPIWHPNDVDRVIGCHIVEQITNEKDEIVLKRITYRKSPVPGGFISVEEAIFSLDDWADVNGIPSRPLQVIRPLTTLPGLTSLPVYHIKNFEEPANPFGSSELRGIERLIGAINQTISDEDLAIALDGIGMYATDAPTPTNEDGEEIDWVLGPGRVVEYPQGHKFERVTGVGSIEPMQSHIGYLEQKLQHATGVSDAAMGIVDVSVAQSGISLQLQFQPMVAKTNEKDKEITAVHAQMFFDLITQWIPTYEGLSFEGMTVEPKIGGKIPVDRVAKFTELNDMKDRGIISAAYYRAEATKLGYTFPDNIQAEIDAEADAAAARAAIVDPFAATAEEELGDDEEETA